MILVKCTNKHFTWKSFNQGSALKYKYVGFFFTKCCVYPINNSILDNKKASQCEISLHRKHPLRQDSCQNSGS